MKQPENASVSLSRADWQKVCEALAFYHRMLQLVTTFEPDVDILDYRADGIVKLRADICDQSGVYDES